MLSVLLCSCTESQYDGEEVSSLSPGYLNVLFESPNNTITFPAKPKDKSFSVISTATPWNITNTASWIKMNMMSGGENKDISVVNMTLEENKQADTVRSCVFFVNSAKEDYPIKKEINVVQYAAVPYIEPELTYKIISGGKNAYRIHVESNFNWQPTSDASWISVVREGDDLLVSTDDNPTDAIKTATIFLQGKATATIQIEQAPAGVKTLTDTLNFDNIAATYTLGIEADMSWSATTAQSWIQVSPTNGKIDDKNLTISVTPNSSTEPREGSVYISVGAQKVRIPVIQKGYYFEVAQDSIIFNSHGSVMQIELNTNESWYANIESTTWLTLSGKSGTKDDKLYITAYDNPSVKERKSNVYIKTDHYPEVEIPILQKNRYLSTSLNAISFFGKGGTAEPIIIDSDANYTIKQDGNWFTITHQGDFISVSAPANNFDDWKEGSITLTSTDVVDGELQVVIPVRQSSNKGNFTKETYNTDVDYNLLSSFGLKIDLVRYSSDTDYNSAGITGINKDNYHENGNIEDGQHAGIEKDIYTNDKNYDNE